MASPSQLPPNRHVEFKKGGWGAAILTCVVTAAAFLTAFYIHERTFREPTDVMMRQVGEQPIEPGQTPTAAHGGAAAGATPGAAEGTQGHGTEGKAPAQH